MKKILSLTAIAIILLLSSSCSKDDDAKLPMEFTVPDYSGVSVDGEVKVLFDRQSSSLKSGSTYNNDEFTIKIKSNAGQRNSINVNSEGGVLIITAEDDIVLSDSVTIELLTSELDEIRLESDQEAIFEGIDQEVLTVVTEARSRLYLWDIMVDNLTCRTEGESEFILTTLSESYTDNQSFEESRGVMVDENTLLVDDSYFVVGDSIKLENDMWIVYGDNVSSLFHIINCDFVTEGETYIDAGDAATLNVNINLEGESEATVWALESISGKGEGNSQLFYVNVNGLDISGFITEGNAQIIPLP
jgi:hypothetical protein